jgi:hypothetical protein
MKRKIFLTLSILGLLVIALAVSNAPVTAQSGGTYELSWSTVDGGGAMNLTGGTYSLSGMVGQFDAGSQSGGTYSLNGGFWTSVETIANSSKLYLPFLSK